MNNRFEPEAHESQPFSFEENERDRPARHARQRKPASRRRAAGDHGAVRRRQPVRPRPRPRFPVRFPIFTYPAWPGLQFPEPAPTPATAEDPDTQGPPPDFAQDGTDTTQSEIGPGGGGSRYVRHVQHRLNRLLGLRLPLDGKLGVMTRSAIRRLQQKNGLRADGIIRPQTARILSAASQRPTHTDEELESEIDRGSYEYALWVQRSLNHIMGSGLVEDGIIGTHTQSAIRDFQRRYSLLVDGIVGPQTEGALIKAGAAPPPGDVSTYFPVPSQTGAPAGSFAWGAKVSPEFRSKVQEMASALKFDPNHLMAAIAFETNESFSPSTRNKYGATGLIQFISPTAQKLGTTTDALARMTDIQQLDYVKKYLQPFNNRLHSLEDVYMAILSPDAIGKPNSTVLMSRYSTDAHNRLAYEQNAPLDANHDGKITKAEAADPVRKRLEKGLQPGNASAAPATGSPKGPIPTTPKGKVLSGSYWVGQFRGSTSVDDLASPFRESVKKFLAALTEAGAKYKISSTYRDPKRQYLMYWAKKIADGSDPRTAESFPGVNIEWWHGSEEASRQAAQQMVDDFKIGGNPVGLVSRHTERKAIDMDISWSGSLRIRNANGQYITITSTPRDGTNPDLGVIGGSYNVHHYDKDRPHWSIDGH